MGCYIYIKHPYVATNLFTAFETRVGSHSGMYTAIHVTAGLTNGHSKKIIMPMTSGWICTTHIKKVW